MNILKILQEMLMNILEEIVEETLVNVLKNIFKRDLILKMRLCID